MPMISICLLRLEAYITRQPSAFRSPSLQKVLDQICKLDEVPRDEEFKVRERSSAILEKMIAMRI